MLQPSNRLTLIDAMRAPAGYVFESAMAVTYTLDLRALLAAPAAFALGTSDQSTSQPTDEPIELLHAVRRYAQRITLFSQFDSIALPPSRKVFTFVENSLLPVRAPRGGVVHPKVWVLRYEPQHADDSQPVHRVLIASRNLTFDESWDTVVRLDETFTGPAVSLGGIADLFDGLCLQTLRPTTLEERHRVTELGAALRERKFAAPTGVDVVRIHTFGFKPTDVPFPPRTDRSLVISPFLTDDFFASIGPRSIDTVVSRPEAIDGLSEATRNTIGELLTFEDGGTDEAGSISPNTDREEVGPGRPLTGLHAKVFAFENGSRAHLFLGSANATGAAFRNNIELLIEFESGIAQLGIDALINGNDDEPGLRRLLTAHIATESTESEPATNELDKLRHDLASLGMKGIVESTSEGWAVTYTSSEPLPALDGGTISCWPLPIPASRRTVSSAEVLDVRFDTTLESISGLLAFEVELDGSRSGFVVPVPLEGLPDDRDRALLKSLIGNAERFFKYLLALLDDDTATASDTRRQVDRLADSSDRDETSGLPVLEQLLRARRTKPEKIASLHPLVTDLAADGVLPDGFIELWELLMSGVLANDGSPG